MNTTTKESPLGFDYTNQAWHKNGVYIRCGHPELTQCGCYGRINEGKPVQNRTNPK